MKFCAPDFFLASDLLIAPTAGATATRHDYGEQDSQDDNDYHGNDPGMDFTTEG